MGRELRLINPLWLIKIIVINQILSYRRRRADLIKPLTGRDDDYFEAGPGSSFLRQTRRSAGSVFTSLRCNYLSVWWYLGEPRN